MDVNSPEADKLFGLLILGGLLLALTARIGHLAIVKADGTSLQIKNIFWRDSVIFLSTLVISLGALLPILIQYELGDVLHYLSALRDASWPFGWAVTLTMATHVFAPFMVGLCLLIGRHRRTKQTRGIYAH